MESLPDRGRSSWHLGAVWALSQYQKNEVHVFFSMSTPEKPVSTCMLSFVLQLYLGTYPDEYFLEKPVKASMEKFRKNLAEISSGIKTRNQGLKMPYYNLSPDRIPNSVAV